MHFNPFCHNNYPIEDRGSGIENPVEKAPKTIKIEGFGTYE
jgi:hypothetical protein